MENRLRYRAYLDSLGASLTYTKEERMVDVKSINFELKTICYCINGKTEVSLLENLKLIQCTGLKDREGNLIYEGDIVEFYSEYSPKNFRGVMSYHLISNTQINQETRERKEISTYEAGFYLDNLNRDNDWILGLNHVENLKIIGNIYENPELLKEKTNK